MDLPKTASPAAILFFTTFREEIFEALISRGWIKLAKPVDSIEKKGADHGNPTL